MKKIFTCLAVLLIAVTAMAFNTITFVFKDVTQKSYAYSDVDSIGMGDPSTPAKDSVYVYLKNKTKEAMNINDLDSIGYNLPDEDSCLTVSAEESDFSFGFDEVSMTAEVKEPKDRDIESIIIPCKVEKDGKIYEVTSIGSEAFSYLNITSIKIPSSITSIGEKSFMFCESLTSIEIPSSVNSIGNMAFLGCRNLMGINVSSENENYTSIDGVLYNKAVTELIAFTNKLTNVKIPSSVTSIGNYAFGECHSLVNIEIPSSVTNIGNSAFEYCSSLTSIKISNSVTSIGNLAFLGCSSLTSIEIPSSVTSIGYYAFEYCSSLETAEVPEGLDISDAGFPETTEIIRY